MEDPPDIAHGLKYLDGRVNERKDPATRVAEFQHDKPRRVYKAIPQKVWMNVDGEINGNFVDKRVEIQLI